MGTAVSSANQLIESHLADSSASLTGAGYSGVAGFWHMVQIFLKRVMDIVGSSLALLVFIPIFLACAVLVKLSSRGPVFYRSIRIGRDARRFFCWKFRTMQVGADERKSELQHLNERDGVFFKIAKDPRVTRVGYYLRRYSLDELPQLLNVFAGDMSLVGPRPSLPEEYAEYTPYQRHRHEAIPGMTGLWQVTARGDPSFDTCVSYDLEYIRRWNFGLDVKILLKTIPVVVMGRGE